MRPGPRPSTTPGGRCRYGFLREESSGEGEGCSLMPFHFT